MIRGKRLSHDFEYYDLRMFLPVGESASRYFADVHDFVGSKSLFGRIILKVSTTIT
jgi:hypothetical protein